MKRCLLTNGHRIAPTRRFSTKPESLLPELRQIRPSLGILAPSPFSDHGRSFSSTATSGSANTLIARTLYRQLLRWCDSTGYDVPLGPIPPVNLVPPRVDAPALQALAKVPTDSGGRGLCSDPSEVGATNNDAEGGQKVTTDAVGYLRRQLPPNSLVEEHMLVVPVRNASDLRGLVRVAYGLNALGGEGDEKAIKDRISLAFDAIKSLNELTRAIDDRKQARRERENRDGVIFHVGQVVEHKIDRWRGVIIGWKKGAKGKRQSAPDQGAGAGKMTSLTTKDYSSVVPEGDHDDDVRYDIILDSGDSHMLSGKRPIDEDSGFPVISQSDLEAVSDSCLLRIRSHWIASRFDRFDAQRNCFVPNEILRYEFPADDPSAVDSTAAAVQPTAEADEITENVIHGVRDFAAHLERRILDSTSCSEARKMHILSSLERRLSALATGEVQNPADMLSANLSTRELAAMHLRPLLHINMEISEMLWLRNIAEKSKDRIRFPLGTIVKHKKYGFRGVVVAFDPKPTVDVSRWDGLQHIENPEAFPFYHVLPDANDCIRVFGGERPFRYVCEENLEACPQNECVIDAPDLDSDWTLDTDAWKYTAPDYVKFRYAESLGDDEDIIVSCLQGMKDDITDLHLSIRDGIISTSEGINAIADKLSMDNLFSLLHDADNLDDAEAVKETVKEMWKANKDDQLRLKLDDGVADLLRGNKDAALLTFTDLVEEDPTYFEAWNKKATCHYMLGEMKKSLEAAQMTLTLHPRHFQAMSGLGLVQYEERRFSLAAESFRRSLGLDPWSPVSSRLAACIDLLKNVNVVETDEEEGAAEGSAPYESK